MLFKLIKNQVLYPMLKPTIKFRPTVNRSFLCSNPTLQQWQSTLHLDILWNTVFFFNVPVICHRFSGDDWQTTSNQHSLVLRKRCLKCFSSWVKAELLFPVMTDCPLMASIVTERKQWLTYQSVLSLSCRSHTYTHRSHTYTHRWWVQSLSELKENIKDSNESCA